MRSRTDIRSLALGTACIALAGGVTLPMAGCRGDRTNKPPRQFFPDLDEQPRYDAQEKSGFFEDYVDEETGEAYGRTQRMPVVGTVAFGRTVHVTEIEGIDFADRDEFLRPDDAIAEGRTFRTTSTGASVVNEEGQPIFDWVETIPIGVDQDLIDLGHKNFNIFCLPCHGGIGNGLGIVGKKWSYGLPNFHDALYQPGGEKGQDGYIFHTIRNGVANEGGPYPLKMPSYARKLTIEETWAVVAYVRVLQQTQRGELDDLTESQRINIERSRTRGAAANQETNQ